MLSRFSKIRLGKSQVFVVEGSFNVALSGDLVLILSDRILKRMDLGAYFLPLFLVVLTIFLQVFTLFLLRENFGVRQILCCVRKHLEIADNFQLLHVFLELFKFDLTVHMLAQDPSEMRNASVRGFHDEYL